jgi:hypothetical protein
VFDHAPGLVLSAPHGSTNGFPNLQPNRKPVDVANGKTDSVTNSISVGVSNASTLICSHIVSYFHANDAGPNHCAFGNTH